MKCDKVSCDKERLENEEMCADHTYATVCVVRRCAQKRSELSRYCEKHRQEKIAAAKPETPTTSIFPPKPPIAGDNEQVTATIFRDITTEGPETKETLGGGATRTKAKYRFELMPECALRRLALRYTGGAAKHGENNWKKGDFMFVVSCFGHAAAHLSAMKREGNTHDDNIGAALWNLSAIAWYEEFKPEEVAKALNYMERGDQ